MPQPRKSRAQTAQKDASSDAIDAQQASTTTALVPAGAVPPDTPASIWQELDRADEEAIYAEIVSGTILPALAYEFEQGGSTVRGLSYVGVNWCVREMAKRGLGKIGIARNDHDGQPLVQLRETADEDGNPIYEAMVVAVDRLLGTENVGIADAKKYPAKRGGGVYTDTHAKRKAISKAQRNAKAGLVEEQLKAELLAVVSGAQLQVVRTQRQQAEVQAGAKSTSRSRGATASRPADAGPVATTGQQRLMAAKFNEGEGPQHAKAIGVDERKLQRVLTGWASGHVGFDRVPKSKVDAVVEVMADIPGTLDVLAEHARSSGESVDEQRARWVIEQVPEVGTALGVDAQQQLAGA